MKTDRAVRFIGLSEGQPSFGRFELFMVEQPIKGLQPGEVVTRNKLKERGVELLRKDEIEAQKALMTWHNAGPGDDYVLSPNNRLTEQAARDLHSLKCERETENAGE